MNTTVAEPASRDLDVRGLVVATVWIAIVTGLVEAAGSMILMRMGRRPGSWWDLFWVSPAFDILLFGATGLGLVVVARLLKRPALPIILPAYGFLTASIWLGLALPYQVHIAALLALSAGLGYQGARLAVRHLDPVMRFWRRTLPGVVALGVLSLIVVVVGRPVRERIEVGGLPPASPDAPNVVLIVIDALRADHLPTHGYERDTSPVLNELARQGVSFQAAFSSSPYTGPSHGSLLTGLYPSEHGVQWIERRPVLSDEHPTISEMLQGLGYRTGAVSANRFWFTREQGYGRGFHHFEDNYHNLADAVLRTAYGRKLDEWIVPRLFEDYPFRLKADRVTDTAVRWASRDTSRPFFLMLNYFDVHDPYFPPDPYRGRYSSKDEPGGILNTYQERYNPDLTPDELQDEIDAYDGAIRYVDAEIGRLLDELEARSDQRDLLVVVTADHGEAFGEHGAYIHANSLYHEEIFVPLIIRYPRRLPAGVTSPAPVSNAAIPATLLELIGAEESDAFSVPSLSSLWSSDSVAHREPAFSEMERWEWNLENAPSRYGALQTVITEEYQLIENDSLGLELYRWREDPLQAHDLIEQDSLRSETHRLEALIRERLPRH